MDSKKHFTEMDRKIFLGVLKKFSHIVENKKSDSCSLKIKEDAWHQITEQYNNSAVISCKRNVGQLKKMWSNMKSIQRNNLMKERQAVMRTGGGPSETSVEIDPEILEIVPCLMSTAPIVFSSNLPLEEMIEKQDVILAEQCSPDVDVEMGDEGDNILKIAEVVNDDEGNDNMSHRNNEIDDIINDALDRPRPQKRGKEESSNSQKTDYDERRLKLERIRRIMKNEEELADIKLCHEEVKNKIEIEFLKEKYALEISAAKATAEKAELDLKLNLN